MPRIRFEIISPSRGLALFCFVVCLASLIPGNAFAQATVQQPSFSTFSAGTTVSVPDRGSAFIGGVNRGASGRNTYGPFPSGTSSGRTLEGSSVTTHVFIHDFEEMDRQILDSGPAPDSGTGKSNINKYRGAGQKPAASAVPLTMQSEHAYQVMLGRSGDLRRTPPENSLEPLRAPEHENPSANEVSEAKEASRLLEKGRKADAAGKTEVACVWFRLAQKHGSAEAVAELKRRARGENLAAAERR